MCGRYLITSAPEAFRRLFGYPEQPNFPPRYNVAPTQPVPIVRLYEGQRQFTLLRWGLIPPWVKDPRKFSLLINARGESVNDKPAFRNAMRRRRCLLPPTASTSGRSRARAGVPISCAPRMAAQSRSRGCGKPGWGRTARRWKRLPSSPNQPTLSSPTCMTACP